MLGARRAARLARSRAARKASRLPGSRDRRRIRYAHQVGPQTQATARGGVVQEVFAVCLPQGLKPIAGAPPQAGAQVRQVEGQGDGGLGGARQEPAPGVAQPVVEGEHGPLPGRIAGDGVAIVEGDASDALQPHQDLWGQAGEAQGQKLGLTPPCQGLLTGRLEQVGLAGPGIAADQYKGLALPLGPGGAGGQGLGVGPGDEAAQVGLGGQLDWKGELFHGAFGGPGDWPSVPGRTNQRGRDGLRRMGPD